MANRKITKDDGDTELLLCFLAVTIRESPWIYRSPHDTTRNEMWWKNIVKNWGTKIFGNTKIRKFIPIVVDMVTAKGHELRDNDHD